MNNLAEQKVWSPYQGDEIPVGEPMTLTQAQAVAAEQGFPGVGIVMTGGVHSTLSGGFKLTLVGFDFIGVDPCQFKLPLCSSGGRTPSGGVRAFGWAPTYWAEQYADSPMLEPPEYIHCERAGFYFGTSPKFLAVPEGGCGYVDVNIKPGWLRQLDRFRGFNVANASNRPALIPAIPAGGELLDLEGFRLSVYEHMLISGNGNKLDREGTLRGLLVKLLGLGVAQKDLLTTIINIPPLWRICQSNWKNNPEGYAKREIGVAVKAVSLEAV